MRNLKLLGLIQQDLPCKLSHLSIDYDTNFVYGVSPQGVLILFDPVHQEVVAESCLPDEFQIPVVGTHHLPDQMALCIATSAGEILLWNTGLNNVECVGSVDGGISGMSWSPDMELVALTTGLNKLILMTKDFDPISETSLTEEGFGEAQLINVGWGKKETQFHGSEGKQAAANKAKLEVSPAFTYDDHQPKISWRGDGQFFAVSLIHPRTGARQIRVWTRAGVLHSTGEDVNGLEQSISYKPSGSLIASSAMSLNKHQIIFFEKNGLRHGDFSLPFKAGSIKVVDLRWNLDSTVLAVWCDEDLSINGQSQHKSYLQLWTCGNYHWYLKQCIEFGPSSEGVASFTWDTESAYRLHVSLGNGQYHQYSWAWTTDCSTGCSVSDQAAVAVIDGDQVLMTPFRTMVVPPPLSAYSLKLPAPASQVAFGKSTYCNDIVVLTNNFQLMLFTHNLSAEGDRLEEISNSVMCQAAGGNGFAVKCSLPKLRASVSLKEAFSCMALSVSHLTCVENNDTFVFCLTTPTEISFVEAKCDWTSGSLNIKSKLSVEKSLMAVSSSNESGVIAVQLCDGQVFRFGSDSGVLVPWMDGQNQEVKFPFACSQMAVGTLGGQEVVLGLTDRYRFFVNDTELANNCSSFSLHDEFLLLTTHSHTLRCICRKTPVEDLSTIQTSKAHVFDETIRRVERGSRIVIAVPDDTKVILQMPRGNLELIHPRALILSAIRKKLDRLEFGEAFNLAKRHRISMNLLYDHNPSSFVSNIETFVSQLNSPSNINLFLTDLTEDDVTVTMYTFAYNQKSAKSLVASDCHSSKLDTVSDIMCSALEKFNADKYVLSILTTFVKKSSPDLESALRKIKSLKETSSSKVSYGEALEYLLYLVDVNKLYDVALGTYDFDLVLMVAEKSQKDPKEYLAFLKELQNMELEYRCYTIDVHLKRFSKALQHISKCGNEHFAECLKLVTEHNLFREALQLFPPQSLEFKEISMAFGEHLGKTKAFQEAGIVFFRAGECGRALEMFETCCDWRQTICMAHVLSLSSNEISELSRRLARKLKDNHRHLEAATLFEQYADDYEEAIVTLIAGYQWTEALRLIYKYKRSDFIETDLKSSLLEAYNHHKALIETQRLDFTRYHERIKVVRKLKAEKLETFDYDDGMQHRDGDLYSDTSSVTGDSVVSGQSSRSESQKSNYSRSSGRTTKSRMKQEKKKWSLREGSPYEEEALIEVLHKMADQVEAWKDDVSGLLRMLVLFHKEPEAVDLQENFDRLIVFVEKCIPEIWTPDLIGGAEAGKPVYGPDSTVNSITQDLNNRKSLPSTALRLGPALLAPPVLNKNKEWKMKLLSGNC